MGKRAELAKGQHAGQPTTSRHRAHAEGSRKRQAELNHAMREKQYAQTLSLKDVKQNARLTKSAQRQRDRIAKRAAKGTFAGQPTASRHRARVAGSRKRQAELNHAMRKKQYA